MNKILFAIIVCLSLASCGGKKKREANSLVGLLEAKTGQDHIVAKTYTLVGDFVVIKNTATGAYTAYNLDRFDSETMHTYDAYEAATLEGDIVSDLTSFDVWVESGYYQDNYTSIYVESETYDIFCECWVDDSYYEDIYIGSTWIDTSGYVTRYSGGGLVFNNTSTASKDLELYLSMDEQVMKGFISSKLKSELSLSNNRAEKLASLVTKYQKLENLRELTQKEKDSFALEALGVNFSDIESAIKKKKEGNESQFTSLMNQAAKVNSTTPEQIGKFVDEFSEYME